MMMVENLMIDVASTVVALDWLAIPCLASATSINSAISSDLGLWMNRWIR